MAEIQFSRGIKEEVVPDIRITRSKTGQTGTATFYFNKPQAIDKDFKEDITGMYMVDEEGEISTSKVNGKFVNGEPMAIEATYIMKSREQWDRFIRFIERYSEENGLTKSKQD
ncbi:MAG: photosystem II reaction center protein Psb28 [Moorea sp. SIO1F2]|uniref:photosystem II reaction center protein Psb28 n=1 Tax=unclassified Moorena TaxID=2683338 RepID=UPI0013B91276|nr:MULTISPECIES: photosystem II reaction center protein Psb28 [unclassified Moorena]NEN99937.1 photosystem II reaction center protein Psb28 [Moorena sp. SIO3I7]NEO08803.1 photosystem II reaction center protein Psb28 [Moorena sp. SIO3I8]NEO21781.1 photosystem II reaction center protein Psb28 [Moorena sp. SIO4A5]NEP22932.1 photosystem II reaction center protein Psb28 [Moorena sp. SIO3I6]NEQ58615.1 photosystem II reaction center protein Psb28 [Moorena sp. SIO4A1]